LRNIDGEGVTLYTDSNRSNKIVPAMADETEPASTQTKNSTEPTKLAPEDFYYEGPYLVFTAAYHLKRGYCCNSNCRHCPYK
jgi:Family of unknown function (DUF5522)